jgi:phage terminase large subunit
LAKKKNASGTLDLTLQPKQAQLLKLIVKSPATWLGYGGSRGAAKSGGIRRIIMALAFQDATNGGFCGLNLQMMSAEKKILLFRRKFSPDLWENHIQMFFREWPQTRSWYNSQSKEITFPNGLVLKFGYAEHEGDINDFQGQEYWLIFIDEATKLQQKELEFLKTCNRWPGVADGRCKMILTMNPGGIGHKFIKRIFFDRDYRGSERPTNYEFIQAYGWDNVEWVRSALDERQHSIEEYYSWDDQTRFKWFIERSDYGHTLNDLPESMRIGHLLGRWDLFAGQYFDIFNSAVHTYRPEARILEQWHSRWLSCDWGFAHPAATYWFAQDGSRTRIYRELLVRQLGPKELAALIVSKAGREEKPEAIYLSPDAFAKRTDADTIAQQMSEVFREAGWPDATPADNDRVGGWALMYEMLKNGQLEISDQCFNLIETLPSMTRDEKRPEDCQKFDASEGKMDGDDSADSARYGLKSRIPSRSKLIELRIEEGISAQKAQGILTDPTSEMIRRAQLQQKMKQASKPVRFAYRRGRGSTSYSHRRSY